MQSSYSKHGLGLPCLCPFRLNDGKLRLCKFSEKDLLHLFVQPVLQALINLTPGRIESQVIKHVCRDISTVNRDLDESCPYHLKFWSPTLLHYRQEWKRKGPQHGLVASISPNQRSDKSPTKLEALARAQKSLILVTWWWNMWIQCLSPQELIEKETWSSRRLPD